MDFFLQNKSFYNSSAFDKKVGINGCEKLFTSCGKSTKNNWTNTIGLDNNNTSSWLNFNKNKPNDSSYWIKNKSDSGRLEQQNTRPQKLDFTKNNIDLLSQFISWYYFVNETQYTRSDMYPDDIINWKTVKSVSKYSLGSMTASAQSGFYSDSGGKVLLSVIREVKGLRGDNMIVRHAESNQTGNDISGELITEFRLVTQDGGAFLSMRIHGRDLAYRIIDAVRVGGFFYIKKNKH